MYSSAIAPSTHRATVTMQLASAISPTTSVLPSTRSADPHADRFDDDGETEEAGRVGEVELPVRVRLGVLPNVAGEGVEGRDRPLDRGPPFDAEPMVAVGIGLEVERHPWRVGDVADLGRVGLAEEEEPSGLVQERDGRRLD